MSTRAEPPPRRQETQATEPASSPAAEREAARRPSGSSGSPNFARAQASATASASASGPTATASTRRASRRGAPRRFRCDVEGCGKLYTRAEHLQRHQLNHNPREIFECNEDGCSHCFVRADLLARHKNRHHSYSYVPRHRGAARSSFSSSNVVPQPESDGQACAGGSVQSIVSTTTTAGADANTQPSPRVPQDAVLMTPESSVGQLSGAGGTIHAPPGWSPTMVDAISTAATASVTATSNNNTSNNNNNCTGNPHDLLPRKTMFYGHVQGLAEQAAAPVMPWGFPPEDTLIRDNFATWLFDTQGHYNDINVANVPFLEGGLESPFNTNIPYDYESLTSRSQLETPPRQTDTEELLSDYRRQEILRWFKAFRVKYPKLEPLVSNLVSTGNNPDHPPALNLEMMRDCLREYWEHVSSRLPIIHEPTFFCNRCSMLLLLVMIALGAASLRNRDASGALADYGGFADVIIWGLRWEIVTAEEATPPVSLAVAQALLLLEFHEKMYSSRRLHERAHIYHSSTLTLLRRGSPLIGRSGSETPPEQHQYGSGATLNNNNNNNNQTMDSQTWWTKWAETESMHRVVYAAFMMDVVHAAMFGHAADMAPHEIRLPLPCDDQLWTAASAESMREKDANLRMYGLRPISFLDGLKRAVHANEVQTHSFGRMVIMCGLLSVGWHLSRREPHLKWLDLTTPGSSETRDGWRKTLLGAFDEWKRSFDCAQGGGAVGVGGIPASVAGGGKATDTNNGPIQSAAVLYRLAHISLHVDIVDCQVYAGAKQLLGRKVSTRDYVNVVARMKTWAGLPATRHAVLHAFKLLYQVLVDQRQPLVAGSELLSAPASSAYDGRGVSNQSNRLPPIKISTYSCRSEDDPHRPWIMYYATLSIWAFVRALRSRGGGNASAEHATTAPLQTQLQPHTGLSGTGGFNPVANYNSVVAYLSGVARLTELREEVAMGLGEGLGDLLDCISAILSEAHSELLREARLRLSACKGMQV
ncbi:hypothetical protein PgNI_06402 [Pyricularia grisea]|uniref:C2H2-type domain-containing protein n=1 Tax=Pyricularia grisea TaxID=148305 RepID=A0A6P8B5R2_PYRGI|nr:hypothetical protein PgNI_06402 [Pyricularia grisea]TLD10632.1 hypothetical protein PgNI_06402 [Pyricularia grisea]